jgi:hypothetical protein
MSSSASALSSAIAIVAAVYIVLIRGHLRCVLSCKVCLDCRT